MRPVGARVLRFDSGFAAEGCGIAFGHACGVRVQRVHKVQRVQRVQRGWYRRFAAMGFMLWRSCIGPPSQPKLALSLPIKGPSFCRLTVFGGSAARGSENQTTAPAARWKCTPLGAIAPLPPEGEVLAALCLEMLMSSKAEWRANLPLRGKSPQAGIGVHFYRPTGRLACFPPGEARLYGFLSAAAINSN